MRSGAGSLGDRGEGTGTIYGSISDRPARPGFAARYSGDPHGNYW